MQQQSFDLDSFLASLGSIQQAPGKLKKRELLLDLTTQSPSSLEILRLALNPRSPMYIGEETNLTKIRSIESEALLSVEEREEALSCPFLSLMKKVQTEEISRGYKALAYIKVFLENQCDNTMKMEAVLSLLQKNPRLGVSWHSFTKVTGSPKFEVMLAKDINKIKKMDEKVQFPVYVQPKLDGYRAIAKVNSEGAWELFSRNGKKYENFPTIIEALSEHGDPETVYDGEIMSDDFQSMQKTAFTVKKKRTVGDVRYHIFDVLQDNEFSRKACYRDFILRLFQAHESLYCPAMNIDDVKLKCDLLRWVPTFSCSSWEKVYEMHELNKINSEGSIVRLNKPYEFKRTDNLMKIKEMKSQDCIIQQVIRGKGKYSEVMGAIRVLQEDGQTICEVGTGFSNEARTNFWNEQEDLKDKMVEIKYQELTPDGVMRFPVFLRFREDK